MTGDDLRSCREAAHLTQAELADQLGMTRTWLAIQERSSAELERRTELAVRYVTEVLVAR